MRKRLNVEKRKSSNSTPPSPNIFSKLKTLEARLDARSHVQDKSTSSRPLLTRERENLQILSFLGAIRAYGYDPAARSRAAKAIEEDLDKLGVPLTDDCIRQHLKSASDLVRGDWRQRLGLKPNSDKS